MASIVITTMDQRLVVGVTYLYQIVQTQLVVAAVSATPISAHKDNSTRSSQVMLSLSSQITRRLDSVSDNYQASEINSYR